MTQTNHPQPDPLPAPDPAPDEFLRLPQRDGTLCADLSVSKVSRIVPCAPGKSVVVFADGGREFVLCDCPTALTAVKKVYEYLGEYDEPTATVV